MPPRSIAGLVALLASTALACGLRSSLLESAEESDPPVPPVDRDLCHSICECIDGSAAIAAVRPLAGEGCFNGCDEPCSARGGVQNAVSSQEGVGTVAFCRELCDRVDALGCAPPCEEILGPCAEVDPSECAPDVAASLRCLSADATLTCDGEIVRFDGCDITGLATCE